MIEDKLTHDERVRLECVAQAVAMNATILGPCTSTQVIDAARQFERYVKGSQERVG